MTLPEVKGSGTYELVLKDMDGYIFPLIFLPRYFL